MSRRAGDREVAWEEDRDAARDFVSTPGVVRLWFGILAAPVAFFLHMEFAYAMVEWACGTGTMWPLRVATLIALLLAGTGALVSWLDWHESGAHWPDGSGGPIHRTRFMALGGFVLSLMFILLILGQAYTTLVLSPCQ